LGRKYIIKKIKQNTLTVSRTLIFTQSAGGPTSATVVTSLPDENNLASIPSENRKEDSYET
jgi:hypothetical protein